MFRPAYGIIEVASGSSATRKRRAKENPYEIAAGLILSSGTARRRILYDSLFARPV
ncbi:hypothetical protein J25TS5_11850 [Paenibacillus faecis]|nr:hypothetical protein J25TS5_11850 [Paenibacillus faecis]